MAYIKISSAKDIKAKDHLPVYDSVIEKEHIGQVSITYWYPGVSDDVIHMIRADDHLGFEDKRVEDTVAPYLKDFHQVVSSHYVPMVILGKTGTPIVDHVLAYTDQGEDFIKIHIAWHGANGPYHGEEVIFKLDGELKQQHRDHTDTVRSNNTFTDKDSRKA